MSDGRDDELYAERSFRPGPPPELREPPPRRSRALGVFVATFALAAFAGVVWYAYDQGLQRGSEVTAPLIKADPSPTKVRPEQPGGLQVPNKDKLVYEAMRPGDASAPRVERLLPPPEKPVDPPAQPPPPPPIPQTSQAAPSAEAGVPPAQSTPPAPSADSGIPPARIVTPAPAPQIPKPNDTEPPVAEARPEPPAPAPPAAAETPAPTAPVPPQVAEKPAAEKPTGTEPAAEKPAETPPPARTPARPAAGAFRIQVGALRDQGAAEAEWGRLQKRFADELGGLEHRIQRVDLGPGKGVFFRIQSGGVSEGAAGAICASLKTKGQPCIVVKP